jgi:hypothetical protein
MEPFTLPYGFPPKPVGWPKRATNRLNLGRLDGVLLAAK